MSKTSADARHSLINAASTAPEGARLMQAIQVLAARWDLNARKAKRPGLDTSGGLPEPEGKTELDGGESSQAVFELLRAPRQLVLAC